MMRRLAGLTVVMAVVFGAGPTAGAAVAGASGADGTVTISGKTFRFGKRYPVLVNALVRVREYPGIWTLSDEKGDYELTVPDNANVTPYIVSGWNGNYGDPRTDPLDPMTQHYNEIDLQTFHTRGEDIVNANFQTPTDLEYLSLRSALRIPYDADGRPKQCAIVTTASVRAVRGVDYDTYWDETNDGDGHGVPGATAYTLPGNLLPTYFNEHVLPDDDQLSTSIDGGIVWRVVPAGTWRVITEHPDTRFASFLATCAPGRVVNANPPWGAYELADGEKPLAASNVAAKVVSARAIRRGSKRLVKLRYRVGERIGIHVRITMNGRKVASARHTRGGRFGTVTRSGRVPVPARTGAGRAKVSVKLTDAAGVSFTSVKTVRIPGPARKRAGAGHGR